MYIISSSVTAIQVPAIQVPAIQIPAIHGTAEILKLHQRTIASDRC